MEAPLGRAAAGGPREAARWRLWDAVRAGGAGGLAAVWPPLLRPLESLRREVGDAAEALVGMHRSLLVRAAATDSGGGGASALAASVHLTAVGRYGDTVLCVGRHLARPAYYPSAQRPPRPAGRCRAPPTHRPRRVGAVPAQTSQTFTNNRFLFLYYSQYELRGASVALWDRLPSYCDGGPDR